jgi:membrane-associated phospholipid phosphatase
MKQLNSIITLVVATLGAASSQADVVTDWNRAALDAIRTGRTPPPMASRNLAILHTSIYDAVNGILKTHKAYFVQDAGPAGASLEAAASSAAHMALVSLFPAQAADFDTLNTTTLAAIPDGQAKTDGIAWGESVAGEILAWRATDGSTTVVDYTPGTRPGDWQPTAPAFAPALLPQWPEVTPFSMTSGAQFRPPAPPPMTGGRWASEYNITKAYGSSNSTMRGTYHTDSALFWANGAGTETPPGHWNTIARAIAAERGNSLAQNARLFALLNIAMADAAIACWDAKYAYNFWRPITAIQHGDTDDNAATRPDANWEPLLFTPPFPEYTSGHSTFSGAGATILAQFYGTDRIRFTTGSDGLPGVQRTYRTLSSAAWESGMSRVYGGIHFMSANIQGLASGVKIGHHAYRNFLRPKHIRPPWWLKDRQNIGGDGTKLEDSGQ